MISLVLLLLAQPIDGAPSTPEEFVTTGKQLVEQKRFDDAVRVFERCVGQHPTHLPCLRLLGSAYAKKGAVQQDLKATERAGAAYRRYLALAPKGDEYVPKLKAIVGEDDGPGSNNAVLEEWYGEAGALMKSDPPRARHLLELGLGFMGPKDPKRAKFEKRLREL